jgi:predicted nucleotidyltransferase
MKNKITTLPDFRLLKPVFKKYPEIQAVYLFGSQAEGRSNSESDLDLAVLSSSSELQNKKLDLLSDLSEVGFCNVDLIFLDTADMVLKYEVIRLNRLIYHTSNFKKGEYYSLILRQYFDFYPYLEVQREAYKRRIVSDSKRNYS